MLSVEMFLCSGPSEILPFGFWQKADIWLKSELGGVRVVIVALLILSISDGSVFPD